ncbi:ATP-binding cassette domain-containing protein [Arachidicoccus sp.]|uniref:ATP-binding cassette domain-containing protein n=1 Tax=Arachidicoccus sp. TaxID=1872624 RepID=UPI003D22BC24
MQITLNNIIPIPLKENLSKRPSDVWHSQIEFEKGCRVKIKAPSGTGKTTLVHYLYKMRSDYDGTILWDNKDVQEINGDELALRRQNNISVIFQDLRLFAQLTARENIELNRVLQKPFYASSVIDEMSEKLGITHILEQRAGICSYGEQQRIAIIRALVQPFDLLVMDEPFSHLDINNSQKAATLIDEECAKRGAGFILTDLDDDQYFNYTTLRSL